jgi:hypothetical protein
VPRNGAKGVLLLDVTPLSLGKAPARASQTGPGPDAVPGQAAGDVADVEFEVAR